MKSEYLTREQLASLFHCTTRTIHNYVKSGAIPAPVKLGRRQLWQRTDVIAFIKAQQAAPEPPAAVAIAGTDVPGARLPMGSVEPMTSAESSN